MTKSKDILQSVPNLLPNLVTKLVDKEEMIRNLSQNITKEHKKFGLSYHNDDHSCDVAKNVGKFLEKILKDKPIEGFDVSKVLSFAKSLGYIHDIVQNHKFKYKEKEDDLLNQGDAEIYSTLLTCQKLELDENESWLLLGLIAPTTTLYVETIKDRKPESYFLATCHKLGNNVIHQRKDDDQLSYLKDNKEEHLSLKWEDRNDVKLYLLLSASLSFFDWSKVAIRTSALLTQEQIQNVSKNTKINFFYKKAVEAVGNYFKEISLETEENSGQKDELAVAILLKFQQSIRMADEKGYELKKLHEDTKDIKEPDLKKAIESEITWCTASSEKLENFVNNLGFNFPEEFKFLSMWQDEKDQKKVSKLNLKKIWQDFAVQFKANDFGEYINAYDTFIKDSLIENEA